MIEVGIMPYEEYFQIDCREEAGERDELFIELFSCLPHCLWFYLTFVHKA